MANKTCEASVFFNLPALKPGFVVHNLSVNFEQFLDFKGIDGNKLLYAQL